MTSELATSWGGISASWRPQEPETGVPAAELAVARPVAATPARTDMLYVSSAGFPATIALDEQLPAPPGHATGLGADPVSESLAGVLRAFGNLLDSVLKGSIGRLRDRGKNPPSRTRPRSAERGKKRHGQRPERARKPTPTARRHDGAAPRSESGRGAPPRGGVKGWIAQALAVLRKRGVPRSKLDPGAIATIIKHESGGNPRAINKWDSNAAAGHPSKGLMQTIDSTFDGYKLKGRGNIWNPVDNIIAGVRYALARYGSLDKVPGVAATARGGFYRGY